jgi:hypothetical protein
MQFGICETAQHDILQALNLIFLAMITTVAHTVQSNAFMYRPVINVFSILSNFNVVDGEFVMDAVNFRQVNVFTLFKLHVCVSAPVFYFSNIPCNNMYLLSLHNVLAQDRNQWQAHVTMVTNFSVPYLTGEFLNLLSNHQFLRDDYIP